MNYNVRGDVEKLKRNLTDLIDREVEAFRAATGLAPCGIRVEFADVTTGGGTPNHFVLSAVHVDFRL